jgi:hypothetical protein
MKTTFEDIDQRLQILQLISNAVVALENEELRIKTNKFKSQNLQWTLRMIQDMFEQLQDALEMEDYNFYLDEG